MMEESVRNTHRWSFAQKALTIFLVSYLLLYMVPFPLDNIRFIGGLAGYYNEAMNALYLWIGNNILNIGNLQYTEMTGSGDTAFDYVRVFIIFVLSVLISIIFVLTDRKRKDYSKLFYWVSVYATYYVCLYALTYGIGKIFEGQFPFPYLNRFEQAYGNSSPMGLLWTFMGYSKTYTVFCGIVETAGGLLILFRKTRVVGALLLIGVMMNIVVLNFSYDVPVKLFSIHLLIATFIILSPDLKNLYNFFIRHKESSLSDSEYEFSSKWLNRYCTVIGFTIAAGFVVSQLVDQFDYLKEERLNLQAPLRGIYNIITFSVNNNIVPPLTTDSERWDKIIIDYGVARLITMNDSITRYNINVDTLNRFARLVLKSDTAVKYEFTYTYDDTYLNLKGIWKGNTIDAALKKKDLSEYLLINRGFHWINETPFNR